MDYLLNNRIKPLGIEGIKYTATKINDNLIILKPSIEFEIEAGLLIPFISPLNSKEGLMVSFLGINYQVVKADDSAIKPMEVRINNPTILMFNGTKFVLLCTSQDNSSFEDAIKALNESIGGKVDAKTFSAQVKELADSVTSLNTEVKQKISIPTFNKTINDTTSKLNKAIADSNSLLNKSIAKNTEIVNEKIDKSDRPKIISDARNGLSLSVHNHNNIYYSKEEVQSIVSKVFEGPKISGCLQLKGSNTDESNPYGSGGIRFDTSSNNYWIGIKSNSNFVLNKYINDKFIETALEISFGSNVFKYKGKNVYGEFNKPTKADIGLNNVQNFPCSSSINSNSPNEYATTAMVTALGNTKAPLSHSHNEIYYTKSEIDNKKSLASKGRVSACSAASKLPSGLGFTEAYDDKNYPTTFGNVLQLGGGGDTELLLGWSGDSSEKRAYSADNYIRSKRDITTAIWSDWAKIWTSSNSSPNSSWGGNFGGYIQDEGSKTIGNNYIDKVNGKSYRCKVAGNWTANTIANFEECNTSSNLEKIKDTRIYATINYNVKHSNGIEIVNAVKGDTRIRIPKDGFYYVLGSGFCYSTTNARFVIWTNSEASFSSRNGGYSGSNIVVSGILHVKKGDIIKYTCPTDGTEFNYVCIYLGADN